MASLRKFLAPAALAACLVLHASPARALDLTVQVQPSIVQMVVDAASDGSIGVDDLVGAGFEALWRGVGAEINRVLLCQEANSRTRSQNNNSGGNATFNVGMTLESSSGTVTYTQGFRAILHENIIVVVFLQSDGSFSQTKIECGRAAGNAPGGPLDTPARETDGGDDSYTFDTEHGRVIIHLPDDMRAGDTISGTAYVEPNGRDDGERRANADTLSGYGVDVGGTQMRVGDGVFRFAIAAAGGAFVALVLKDRGGRVLGATSIPPAQSAAGAATQSIPALMQAGRPIPINGNFDGNLTNTHVSVGGQPSPILAESPRQSVVMSPNTPTGPVNVSVRDGAHSFQGMTNNLAVSLNARRTVLARDERTQVTLRVVGLQGVQSPVEVALSATPSVNLQGGNQQTITIAPRDANAAGEFSQRFNLRVVAAGPFDVTARLENPACTDPIESDAARAFRLAMRNRLAAQRWLDDARAALPAAQRAREDAERAFDRAFNDLRTAQEQYRNAPTPENRTALERMHAAWAQALQARSDAQARETQAGAAAGEAERQQQATFGPEEEAGRGISDAEKDAIGRQENVRSYNQRCAGQGR